MRLSTPILLALALAGLTASTAPAPLKVDLIPGSVVPDRGPDGNTIIFEGEAGLIVVDTGRHIEHQAKILDLARSADKPIIAIVNTHWHLDHSGGNQALRKVYPQAQLYTSDAVAAALDGFLADQLAKSRSMLADPKVGAAAKAEIRLGVEALEDRKDLLPDRPVTRTTIVNLAPGGIVLHLAKPAATAGDTWVFEPVSKTLVAGDLVVLPVPFFDTACAKGWRTALDAFAKVDFKTLYPGHGPAFSRADFLDYRRAFDRLLDCAASRRPAGACVAGWLADAGRFVKTKDDRAIARALLPDYIDRIIRAPDKQAKLCTPT